MKRECNKNFWDHNIPLLKTFYLTESKFLLWPLLIFCYSLASFTPQTRRYTFSSSQESDTFCSSNKKVHFFVKAFILSVPLSGRFFSEICTPLPSPSGLLKCHPLKMSFSDQSIKTVPLLQDTYFFSGLLSVFLQRNINYKEERPLFYALLYPQSKTVACTICWTRSAKRLYICFQLKLPSQY